MEEEFTNKSYHEIVADLVRWFDFFDNECFASCEVETDKDNIPISERYYTESGKEVIDDIVTVGGCNIVVSNANIFINEALYLLDIGIGKFASYLQGVGSEKGSLSLLDLELHSKLVRFLFDTENDEDLEDALYCLENYYNLVKEIKRWRDYFEVFNYEIIANTEKSWRGNDLVTVCNVLDNDEAKELFERAIKVGLMEKVDGGFKWKKSKRLLAYFAERVSDKFKLGKGEYNGKTKISWKPFEDIFGVEKLGGSKNDYQKDGKLPNGSNQIDSLFEE